MFTEPQIVQLPDQPYVGIKALVTMDAIGSTIPPLVPELFGWLGSRDVEPAGPPFFKYNVVDMERQLEIEAGVPVAETVSGDDRVLAGLLPGGKYATLTHVGEYSRLIDATAALLAWAKKEGLKWDVSDTDGVERWTARLEVYLTDPEEEPDPEKWETELHFRLAG